MAKREQLRTLRANTVINVTSQKRETDAMRAMDQVAEYLEKKYGTQIDLAHRSQWLLCDIVAELRQTYPDVQFHYHQDTSSLRPDGGVLYIRGKEGDALSYPILIAEVKHQGTNDARATEGLSIQAKGNAIERLGKNVIGLRTALMREAIFPFVCFGYGCDFEAGSSILDRVTTIAMFGELNKTHLYNEGGGKFNRGSFYFRPTKWSVAEMVAVMQDIADRAIMYYFSKYKQACFKATEQGPK
ncbi:MAG: EcoRI family type II restriction endonuclease [Bryobacteraceae bacterium]|jgi:type II restriction enzyme